MKKVNKTTAAVLAGAIVTALGALFPLDDTVLQSIQTLLTAAAVYFIPNVDA